MKQAALWTALIIAVAIAASLAVARSKTATAALQRSVSPGALSPAHAYLADRCTSCHEATVGVTVAKCTACHAADEKLLGRQPSAFHASIAECATCHVEHQPVGVRPLRMDHVALAQIGARSLLGAALRDDDSAATLRSLETWFRISSPQQLDADSTLQVLNCAGCHDHRDPHFKRFGSDCAQCHGLTTWSVPRYLHPSPQSKECIQCHQPPPSHAMEHFAMVSQTVAHKLARVDQCYECHLTTSWNDIAGVGFYKHH